MTTIDHQQAARVAVANTMRQIEPNLYKNPANPEIYYGHLAEDAIRAAAPHLRAGIADELLDDTPGSPLTRGYQRLMDPKTGEHPVRTWEAAVRVMLDTLLEGGGEDK